jgi:hypothetical protein
MLYGLEIHKNLGYCGSYALHWMCGAMGTMGTSSGTGAAVGEVGNTTGSVEDRYIQNPSESWNTRGWDRGSHFGANPALGNPEPPGFNSPGGEGGDSGE